MKRRWADFERKVLSGKQKKGLKLHNYKLNGGNWGNGEQRGMEKPARIRNTLPKSHSG